MFKNIQTATWLLFVLIFLNVLDFATTYYALGIGAVENNPVMAFLMDNTGTVWSLLWIKVLVLGIVIVPYYTVPAKKNVWSSTRMRNILIGLNLLFLYVVISNSIKIQQLVSIQV